MKFCIEAFYEIFAAHVDFYLNRPCLKIILLENLHAFWARIRQNVHREENCFGQML
jgi:hypothetical protein